MVSAMVANQGIAGKVTHQFSRSCWRDFPLLVKDAAVNSANHLVCEIGGGARPALDLDFVEAHGINYTVMDISSSELAKADARYNKVQADIGGELPDDVGGPYDLLFSKTLAEHVRDAERFHRNVLSMLAEGGTAIHLFPTLYAPAFVVNRLMPARVSRWLLKKVQGSRRDAGGLEGKFPAYYSWCRGPSPRQIRKFERMGYSVLEYRSYYGTPGYYRPLQLGWLDDIVSRALVRWQLSVFSAYAIVVLRRSAIRRHS